MPRGMHSFTRCERALPRYLNLEVRPRRHPVTNQPCKIPADGWRFIETTMKERIKEGYVQFREDHTKSPFLKSYLYVEPGASIGSADEGGEKYQAMGSVFYRHSQPSNDVIKELFGEKIFENPKDHEILARFGIALERT